MVEKWSSNYKKASLSELTKTKSFQLSLTLFQSLTPSIIVPLRPWWHLGLSGTIIKITHCKNSNITSSILGYAFYQRDACKVLHGLSKQARDFVVLAKDAIKIETIDALEEARNKYQNQENYHLYKCQAQCGINNKKVYYSFDHRYKMKISSNLVSVEDSSKNELMSIKVDAKYVLEKLKVRSLQEKGNYLPQPWTPFCVFSSAQTLIMAYRIEIQNGFMVYTVGQNPHFLDEDHIHDRVLAGIKNWSTQLTLVALDKPSLKGLYFLALIDNLATVYRYTFEDHGNGFPKPSLVKTYQLRWSRSNSNPQSAPIQQLSLLLINKSNPNSLGTFVFWERENPVIYTRKQQSKRKGMQDKQQVQTIRVFGMDVPDQQKINKLQEIQKVLDKPQELQNDWENLLNGEFNQEILQLPNVNAISNYQSEYDDKYCVLLKSTIAIYCQAELLFSIDIKNSQVHPLIDSNLLQIFEQKTLGNGTAYWKMSICLQAFEYRQEKGLQFALWLKGIKNPYKVYFQQEHLI